MDTASPSSGKQTIRNIEVSVDSCAEIKGQVYDVLTALHDVYSLSGMRDLTYVDTYRGFSEKSKIVTPELLSVFGEPGNPYGRFIYNIPQWRKIVQTHECEQFSETAGKKIYPRSTARVIRGVDEICDVIRERAFAILSEEGRDSFQGKPVSGPEDIDIVIKKEPDGSYSVADPLIEQVLGEPAVSKRWSHIVSENPVLAKRKEKNEENAVLVDLIANVQETKAIAAALLYHFRPEEAERMGEMPALLTESAQIPPLTTLREHAHEFGHLTFPNDITIWQYPEIQQAINYTALQALSDKPYVDKSLMKPLHKNAADRAAIAYFLNHLAAEPDARNTLYILVTHDGPLTREFADFVTGTIQSGKLGSGKYKPLETTEYTDRQLKKIEPSALPYSAVLTNSEFAEFVKSEQQRVREHCRQTPGLDDALNALSAALDAFEEGIQKDGTKPDSNAHGSYLRRLQEQSAPVFGWEL